MFRRSLFLGLTLMLAAVLVYLVLQGRRQEKRRQDTPKPVEIVRESPPSLMRVIAPDDLEIVESKMVLGPPATEQDSTRPAGLTATHTLVIRNTGRLPYHDFALKLNYLNVSGSLIETRIVRAPEALLPGQSRAIGDIKVENIPAGAVKCEARIANADLESGAASSR